MMIRRSSVSLLISMLMMMSLPAAPGQVNPASAGPSTTSSELQSGKYEGTSKNAVLGDVALTGELTNENGKLTGKIETRNGTLTITEGSFKEGQISMKFRDGGLEGTAKARLKDGKIVGEWTLAGQLGTFELKRVGAITATTVKPN